MTVTEDLSAVVDRVHRGVAFNTPPPEFIPGILNSINAAVANIPEGKNGVLVAVADLSGANAAIVVRVGDDWAVKAWIGKEWKGPLSAGVQVMGAF